jgi:hypothetical protein
MCFTPSWEDEYCVGEHINHGGPINGTVADPIIFRDYVRNYAVFCFELEIKGIAQIIKKEVNHI